MLRIYLKPLYSKKMREKFEKILDKRLKYNLARAGVKRIKEAQKQANPNGKGVRIRKGVNYTIGRRSVTFYLSQLGGYHNYGVRRHKMKYLMKAKRPIPIRDKKTGEIVFRWASKKSMRKRGSWTHPGLKPQKFLEKGLSDLKQDFKKRLRQQVRKYLSKG